MKSVTIALSITEGSNVYEEFRYPAGELQIRLKPFGMVLLGNATAVSITSNIRSGDDFMRLALLRDAVGDFNPELKVNLVLPYLPYGRADRRFVKGDCFGLAVFAILINRLNFQRVVTLDAHSDVSCAAFNNFLNVSSMPFITYAVGRFAAANKVKEINVLYPDEGARARYQLPERLQGGPFSETQGELVLHLLNCTKKRDAATGKLSGFQVPSGVELGGRPTIIVDDLCDAGGTFIGIAKLLVGDAPLGLYVTHGIFSQGVQALRECFSRIYSSDSFRSDLTHEECHLFQAEPLLAAALAEELKEVSDVSNQARGRLRPAIAGGSSQVEVL